MKSKICLFIVFVLVLTLFCGCQSREVEKPGDIQIDVEYHRDFPVTYDEYRKFLVDTFHMSYEVLGDIDVAKFVKEFDLYNNYDKLTDKEVEDLFFDFRGYYEGQKYAPFILFEYENIEGALPSDYKTKGINVMAVRVWNGNNPPEMTVFVGNPYTRREEYSIYKQNEEVGYKVWDNVSIEYSTILETIVDNAEIYNWNTENIDKSLSFGSFTWDLIFILSDGTFAKYHGSSNESFYPVEYQETIEKLLNIDNY